MKTMSRTALAATALTLLSGSAAFAEPPDTRPARSIVIVHGALADGSGWSVVAAMLEHDGYQVTVVQDPQTALADDVAATERIINQQSGPTVLVSHSYSGAVITQAGTNPKVTALVYVAAVVPEVGESTAQLASSVPAASNDIQSTPDGFLYIDPAKFPKDFAADLPGEESNSMAHSQVLVAATAFATPVTAAAWHDKPSYGIVPTADRILNPDLERSMYARAGAKVTEVRGSSHVVFMSHPRVVADVIEEAARSTR